MVTTVITVIENRSSSYLALPPSSSDFEIVQFFFLTTRLCARLYRSVERKLVELKMGRIPWQMIFIIAVEHKLILMSANKSVEKRFFLVCCDFCAR